MFRGNLGDDNILQLVDEMGSSKFSFGHDVGFAMGP
jgi:hypothetical protein